MEDDFDYGDDWQDFDFEDWQDDDFEDCDEPYIDRDSANAAFYDEWED